ncbi:MAG: DUF3944 domain-containing protein [Candidatus Schmidhempelia sp.]|nr:DUF3944 domain-containing protein [Candidatus Schmidhempelia sp.]
MAYRYDMDLIFLSECNDKELNDLVYWLTHNEKDEKRLTKQLTKNSLYKKFYPEHSQYWEEIAAEIQCFGANTIATIFREGKGVLYKEVLCDVCNKIKVNYNSNSTVENIENNLLMKLLTDSIDKMTKQEIRALYSVIGIKDITSVTPQALTAAFQFIFQAGGFKSD